MLDTRSRARRTDGAANLDVICSCVNAHIDWARAVVQPVHVAISCVVLLPAAATRRIASRSCTKTLVSRRTKQRNCDRAMTVAEAQAAAVPEQALAPPTTPPCPVRACVLRTPCYPACGRKHMRLAALLFDDAVPRSDVCVVLRRIVRPPSSY